MGSNPKSETRNKFQRRKWGNDGNAEERAARSASKSEIRNRNKFQRRKWGNDGNAEERAARSAACFEFSSFAFVPFISDFEFRISNFRHRTQWAQTPAEQFAALRSAMRAAGVPLCDAGGAEQALRTLRETYEPFLRGLGKRLVLTVPPLMAEDGTPDNWQRSAWMKPTPGIGAFAAGDAKRAAFRVAGNCRAHHGGTEDTEKTRLDHEGRRHQARPAFSER
jgi:hypothetical protein